MGIKSLAFSCVFVLTQCQVVPNSQEQLIAVQNQQLQDTALMNAQARRGFLSGLAGPLLGLVGDIFGGFLAGSGAGRSMDQGVAVPIGNLLYSQNYAQNDAIQPQSAVAYSPVVAQIPPRSYMQLRRRLSGESHTDLSENHIKQCKESIEGADGDTEQCKEKCEMIANAFSTSCPGKSPEDLLQCVIVNNQMCRLKKSSSTTKAI